MEAPPQSLRPAKAMTADSPLPSYLLPPPAPSVVVPLPLWAPGTCSTSSITATVSRSGTPADVRPPPASRPPADSPDYFMERMVSAGRLSPSARCDSARRGVQGNTASSPASRRLSSPLGGFRQVSPGSSIQAQVLARRQSRTTCSRTMSVRRSVASPSPSPRRTLETMCGSCSVSPCSTARTTVSATPWTLWSPVSAAPLLFPRWPEAPVVAWSSPATPMASAVAMPAARCPGSSAALPMGVLSATQGLPALQAHPQHCPGAQQSQRGAGALSPVMRRPRAFGDTPVVAAWAFGQSSFRNGSMVSPGADLSGSSASRSCGSHERRFFSIPAPSAPSIVAVPSSTLGLSSTGPAGSSAMTGFGNCIASLIGSGDCGAEEQHNVNWSYGDDRLPSIRSLDWRLLDAKSSASGLCKEDDNEKESHSRILTEPIQLSKDRPEDSSRPFSLGPCGWRLSVLGFASPSPRGFPCCGGSARWTSAASVAASATVAGSMGALDAVAASEEDSEEEDELHHQLHLRRPEQAGLFRRISTGKYSFQDTQVQLKIIHSALVVTPANGKDMLIDAFLAMTGKKLDSNGLWPPLPPTSMFGAPLSPPPPSWPLLVHPLAPGSAEPRSAPTGSIASFGLQTPWTLGLSGECSRGYAVASDAGPTLRFAPTVPSRASSDKSLSPPSPAPSAVIRENGDDEPRPDDCAAGSKGCEKSRVSPPKLPGVRRRTPYVVPPRALNGAPCSARQSPARDSGQRSVHRSRGAARSQASASPSPRSKASSAATTPARRLTAIVKGPSAFRGVASARAGGA